MPVAGQTVSFTLSGKKYSATTNASGIARITVNARSKAGTYSISVTYGGNGTYASSSASPSLVVN